MPIIIIESPNKREKIKSITGYEVEATKGHFMELKEINVEENYKPIFDYMEVKKHQIFNIIEKCKNNEVYIATDPDREGYAIGFLFYLKIKNIAKAIYRAEFHEITPSGVKKGLKEAVPFANTNFKYYDSFLGRRISDNLIGFIISPILKNEINAKSAGRVQTPALKLIVDRFKEIEEFDKLPLESKLSYQIQAKILLNSKEYTLKHSNALKEYKFENKEEAEAIFNNIKDNKVVLVVDKKSEESSKSPPKPFTTSKLLKFASKSLKLDTEQIQKLAQDLFEKGLITYIRTDSTFISKEFLNEMKAFYEPIYKDIYQYKEYSAGKASQAEAHEAIRITHCHRYEELESILAKEGINDSNAIKLYRLIFFNTICSQLKPAIYNNTKLVFNIKSEEFILNIKNMLNKGYLEIFDDNEEDNEIDKIDLSSINPNQTIPLEEIFIKEITKSSPSLYLESDFIEVLEKSGIGRPSTYATYIPKLLSREYISINAKRQLEPTKLGIGVIEFLEKHKFKFVLDLDFSKELEDKLDLIKDDKYKLLSLLKEIHHKLDFIPLNKTKDSNAKSNINPPSQKQMDFAKSISEKLNIALPKNIESDWRIATDFINNHKDKLKRG